jgi:hypothetical protein
MAQGRDFSVLFPLYDVTIYDLPPASTGVVTPVSGAVGAAGQNSYLQVTPNTIPNGSGALPSGLAAEALIAEVVSPVVSNGGSLVYPDLQWWFYPDATDLRNPTPAAQLFFDGSYGANMMPPRAQTVGGDQRVLGISLRRLLTEALNGHARSNMPFWATGVKYNSTLQLKLSSQRGFGAGVAGDTVITPGRIRIWGERYTDKMLAPLARFWNGAFSRVTLRRQLEAADIPVAIAGVHAGRVSVADIATLPGGYGQNGAQIHRHFTFAYNAVAAAAQFFLTNSQPAGGAQGNVSVQYSGDLGNPFAPVNGVASNAKSAVIYREAGIVAGIANVAYFGAQVGGANVPDPNGWPVSQGVDRQAYGNVQPLRSDSGLFYALPELEGEIDVYAENAAWFVTPTPGQQIAANAAAVAVGGIAIQLA